ncbi:uncharacterized protein ACBR49_019274 [Aulostomus maculatus]
MEAETLDSLAAVSKAEILRGIIAEKLTTAAQEILAAVERVVADYEDAASGFRRDIERQRRQMELLLQPQVKLERTDDQDLFPVCHLVQEVTGGPEYKYEPSVITSTEGQMDEEEDGAALSSTPEEDQLAPLDEDVAPRLTPPRVRSDRRSASRRRTSVPKDVSLRIRILEDSQIHVVSTSVLQKYPLQELQFPRGLQEAEFLLLLRATFPHLEGDQPFDIFTCDRSKRLKPLNVKTLTPEEIYSSIKTAGYTSTLYVQLKDQAERPAADVPASQRKDAERLSTSGHKRLLSPAGRRRSRTSAERQKTSELQNHVDLRIRILEDSQTEVLSTNIFQKCPVLELQCPRGLQEADFLRLLRSTFPQLAANQPFDIFTCDRNKRLNPLRVEMLTPEEIDTSIRSIGNSALYIRRKPSEEAQVGEEEVASLLRKDAASPDSSPSPGPTRRKKRLLLPRSERKSACRQRRTEAQTHFDFKIRILENCHMDMVSPNLFQKYPLQELRCPRDLQEADFHLLLKSTFPQLAADQPFDVLTCDHAKRLNPLNVKTLTPEEIRQTIKSMGHKVLFIRLKPSEDVQVGEDELSDRKRKDAAPSASSGPARRNKRLLSPKVPFDRRTAGRQWISEEQTHVDLRIRILEDSQINVLSTSVFQKCPIQELQCPRGLQEEDFLRLLSRSTSSRATAIKD